MNGTWEKEEKRMRTDRNTIDSKDSFEYEIYFCRGNHRYLKVGIGWKKV